MPQKTQPLSVRESYQLYRKAYVAWQNTGCVGGPAYKDMLDAASEWNRSIRYQDTQNFARRRSDRRAAGQRNL